MSKKLAEIKNALSKKHNNSRYGYLFSFVALVEVVMILVVSTFAWVETISSIEIQSDKWKIDTYTYTRAEIGSGSGFSGNPIDLASYINESGNVHLASASSHNGIDFFFPQIASAGSTRFRKGNLNDKNTNYISFSMKVKAVGSSAKFYFSTGGPKFEIKNSKDNTVVKEVADNSVRCAISVAASETAAPETHVYSYTADSSESVVANTDGTNQRITAIRSFSDYDKSIEANTLFQLAENEEKLITVTLWLQDPSRKINFDDKDLKLACDNFQIVTGTVSTVIEFRDRTSGFNDNNADASLRKNTWQWVANDGAKMWVRTAANKNYELTQSATDPTSWSVSVADKNIGSLSGTLTFYRTDGTVTSEPQNAGSKIFNTWTTKLSEASSTEQPVYTAYGSIKSGKEGYGTWKPVSEILLYSDNAEAVLPTPAIGSEYLATQVRMRNTAYEYIEMNYNNGFWRGFVPKTDTSKNLTFSFSNGGKSYSISAVNRDINEDVSKYAVTSATTGYWEPPAIVEAKVGTGYGTRGTVSVSGGQTDATKVKVTKGTGVQFTAKPKSADYAFEGWYSDAACTKKVSSLNPLPYTANNTTTPYVLYAKFLNNIRLYAVTKGGTLEATNSAGRVQIGDGATGKSASSPVENGESVTIKALNDDASNYQFTGWYDKDGNKLYTEDVKTLTVTAPTELYAHFDVKTYVLDAYAVTKGVVTDEGGGVRFDPQTVYLEHATITVAYTDTTEVQYTVKGSDGYDFLGWYKDQACTQLITNDETITIDKTTTQFKFYAKFELRKYTVKAFSVTNGALGTAGGTIYLQELPTSMNNEDGNYPPSIQATHGNKVNFFATPNAGYAFAGWYDAASGGELLSTEANPFSYPVGEGVGLSGDVTLYAHFKKQFTVSLTAYTDGVKSSTGGTVKAGSSAAGATSTVTVLYGDSVNITATPTTKYLFSEWKGTDGTPFGTNSSTTISNVKKNYTINGYFKIKQFVVKAIAMSEGSESTAGGTVEFTNPAATSSTATVTVKVNHSGSATFKANVKSTDGYEFKGWYSNSSMTGTPVSTSSTYTYNNITSNKTLYAKFVLKQYTVTASVVTNGDSNNTDGGSVVQVINGTEQTPGSAITVNNVKHGTSLVLKAKPVTGATFEGWYDAATGGNRLDNPANASLTIAVKNNMQVYARFKLTAKTTTIYVAPRQGWSQYNLYLYNSNDNKYNGNWPGGKLSLDQTTGFYKFTFTTSDTGKFYAIISDNGNNQMPGAGQSGLEGNIGGTYLISESKMVEFNPVTVTIGAVTKNSAGTAQSNGFVGGKITVDSHDYTSVTQLTYNSGSSFTAKATANSGYEFKGWYTNASCTGTAISTNATLPSRTLNGNATYYALFQQPSKVRIYLKDGTSNSWVNNSNPWMKITDKTSGTVYTFIYVDDNNWYADVSPDLNSCKITRNTSDGTTTWNTWDNLTRNGKTTVTIYGDNNATWS